MTVTSLTAKIANTAYTVLDDGNFNIADKIEQVTQCTFTVIDLQGTYSFQKGQQVTITDTLEGLLFSGSILTDKKTTTVGNVVYHNITCTDKVDVLDKQSSNKLYNNQYAGTIAVDQIKDQWVNGILANFAIDTDTTQADFSAGNLNGTVAANNVEDGNLELAPAGTTTIIQEASTSAFNSGTLTNCTASNNSLAPSATSSLKMIATQSVAGIANSYSHVKIWSGSVGIISGRYLEYDIWINSSCPENKFGVDLHFTDGTALRDNVVYTDAQNKSPHPATDLSGLAVDQWYHRKFLLDNLTSKTIDYVTIVCDGDKTGTYTAYFKNVLETDGAGTTINTFFGGSLNVNPPQQVMKQGYSTTNVSVASTYDCSTAQRVSSAYNVANVGILRNAFISWKSTLPANTDVQLYYSLDSGNSYTQCTNNAALPNLPAGLSLSSKSITFLEKFIQNAGATADAKPILTSVQLAINPSYVSSKTDVTFSASTNSEWNAGTLSNTQVIGNVLSLLGATRNWDNADISNQTVFAGGATGPNNANSTTQMANNKEFSLTTHQNTQGWSRFDFAGQWANFIAEYDNYVDNNLMKNGLEYRTTGISNYDAQYAYAIEIFGTTIALQRGSNSNTAANGTRTQVASATVNLTSQATHHIKVIVNGSSHQIYFDDTLAINATDGTYTGSGYVGFRVSNTDTVNGYISRWDNFGVTVTGLSGTWTSANTSIAGATTYGGSVVSWDQSLSDPSNNTVLVEASLNNGSTYAMVTNGGTIPGLTLGQSLSGVSVKFRITLSTTTATALPQVRYFVCRVLGGFSSSGTRINKALLLSSVVTCGSTLVSWNALTPTGTSVTVATSLDGTSYTNISNGGNITGLNQQPTPTIDTFNLITSGSYTNTHATGGTSAPWIWDTTNSRLTVTGGSFALLLYGAISTANVDVIADMDQSDTGGIVFCYVDVNNYYQLIVGDASSSGDTDVITLVKRSSGTRSFLASGSIAFVRGTKRRIRAVIASGTITVYFDGTWVLAYIDPSPLGAGQSGLSHDSGTSHFYNLRIQPLGDNLSGKKVWVKETLTSTDPLQTPQITDMTTLITNPNIGAGSLVPTADYRNTYKSDNIKDLAKRSNYYWNIKQDGSYIFLPRETTPSPWIVTREDMLPDNLEVDNSADLYRNRHILTNVQSTIVTSEIHTGDGSATSFTLKYPVASMTSIALNGQSKTFGLKGTTGRDFYFTVGDNSIAQDSSGTVLQNLIDQLVISYTGQTTTSVTRDNTGQFSGTISQKQYLDQSGVYVPVQVILNQASAVVSSNGNSDDLDVSLVKRIAVDINIVAQIGISPTVRFFVDRKGADGSYDPIWDSGATLGLGTISITIGARCTVAEVLGSTVRIRWIIGGSSSPSKTFSISIQGRVDPSLGGIGIVEAVEDASSLNINVAAAQALGDSRLQQYGAIGRAVKFTTKRKGLSAGQYLSLFHALLGLNDATTIATSVTRRAKYKTDSGSPSTSYFFDVEASDGTIIPSWSKTLNNSL